MNRGHEDLRGKLRSLRDSKLYGSLLKLSAAKLLSTIHRLREERYADWFMFYDQFIDALNGDVAVDGMEEEGRFGSWSEGEGEGEGDGPFARFSASPCSNILMMAVLFPHFAKSISVFLFLSLISQAALSFTRASTTFSQPL